MSPLNPTEQRFSASVNVDALRQSLSACLPTVMSTVLLEVGSTNSWLSDRLRDGGLADLSSADMGVFSPVQRLVWAHHQSAGRGRQGRAWVSAPGCSLTFSVAFGMSRQDLSGLSLAVGVVVAESLEQLAARQRHDGVEHSHFKVWLKWPNDLVAGAADSGGWRAKLGGVLIETVPTQQGRACIVGVGVNLERLSGEVSASYGATSLSELGLHFDVAAHLPLMAKALFAGLCEFDVSGFSPFAARFASRNALLGLRVHTSSSDCPVGWVRGVGSGGALLLGRDEDSSLRHEITSGEVSIRPVMGVGAQGQRT
jgi:BirA family biotin operon repressor/biotin-[acetyl-CoA-carboxylase] ligase